MTKAFGLSEGTGLPDHRIRKTPCERKKREKGNPHEKIGLSPGGKRKFPKA